MEMSNGVKKEKRSFKKLGYTHLETAEIVQALNKLIANYHVHYQKLRNFHWNVKGGDFFDLHEKFEELYNEAKVNIDEIAERIKVFGQTPLSTMKDYLEVSEIKEVDTNLTGIQMVKEVLRDFETLLSFLVEAADAALEVGDVGTQDLINTFIRNIEKHHWMLNAFSSPK